MIMDDDEKKSSKKKPKSNMKATKDFKLLSFGEEAEDEEETLVSVQKTMSKKPKSSHDLLNDPKLSKETSGASAAKTNTDTTDLGLEGDIEVNVKNETVSDLNIESLRDKLKKPKKAGKRTHEEGNTFDHFLEANHS